MCSTTSAQVDDGTLSIVCPDGAAAGDTILVTTPSGVEVNVVVPDGVGPGDTFAVDPGSCVPDGEDRMAVEVPEGVVPGQSLLVTTPAGEEIEVVVPGGLTAGDTFEVAIGEILRGSMSASAALATPVRQQMMNIECPEGVEPGQALLVEWQGQEVQVLVPEGVLAGQSFECLFGEDDTFYSGGHFMHPDHACSK